jgi:DNA-directed RNA polymerase subunit RPC12/RpoP
MLKCSQCGGRLRRVHRTLFERFRYSSIYHCKRCDSEEYVPRVFQYRLGPYARCPRCGTYRLSKLKEPDKIDKMHTGSLFHCRYCRVQFYDRRTRATEGSEDRAAERKRQARPHRADD